MIGGSARMELCPSWLPRRPPSICVLFAWMEDKIMELLMRLGVSLIRLKMTGVPPLSWLCVAELVMGDACGISPSFGAWLELLLLRF